jgi:peroxiredoxin
MRKNIVICSAALCLLLSSFAIAGMTVDYAAITTISGEIIDEKTLNDNPVILSVMAEWCPSCRAEAYELQRAYEEYKDKGVLFTALFIKSTDNGIKKFAERNGVTFPVGQDNGIARQLGVWSIPVMFIIEKDGKIREKYFGRINEDAIRRGIEEIVK